MVHIQITSVIMANSSNTSEANIKIGWIDTDAAIVFFVLNILVCLANEFLLYLLIKMLNRQDTLVEKLLRCYGIFNMVCTPILTVLLLGVIGLSPISFTFDDWFCDITFFLVWFWNYLNASFSLMVVCLMHVCLVHEAKVNSYGKQSVIDLFCISIYLQSNTALCLILLEEDTSVCRYLALVIRLYT